jgi:enoyl-CoA hydratase/carnithine racemase
MLTAEMLTYYIQCLHQARNDDEVRAVIVTSAVPGRFSAGLDLNALYRGEQTGANLVDKLYLQVADAQVNLNKPSIAAVNGTARGGGMTLAIGCDVILCSENATFGYPEIFSGILPSIHFYHLPRIIGKHRAFELLFSGRSFGSAEAKDLGLISGVYPESELLAHATELATVFSNQSPEVMQIGRRAFKYAADPDYLAGVQNAVNNFIAINATESAKEGISSFMEKRDPNWRSS